MNQHCVIAIEPGNRIQLPQHLVESLGLQGFVAVEQVDGALLVKPCPRFSWDDISASKLVIGSAAPGQDDDTLELTGDDFLF
jgi:antitoxin component of MazEF toxin-antitoxin module